MTVLSDEQLAAIFTGAGAWQADIHRAGLRAVAEAAVQAEREGAVAPKGMRDALMSAYRVGNMSGHERTVEGYWSDDVEEMAGDIADAMINTLTEAHDKANGRGGV